MKKHPLCALLLLTSAITCFADSFTDAIQDLAVVAACKGSYSATQAGGGWYDDPHDYYTPQMLASRFARESGNQTKTATFYGVCFDYAQAAWEYIGQYESWYRQQGMYERQYWVAGVHSTSNPIELMSIGTRSDYSKLQNGVPVKTYANSSRNVYAHGNAKAHAWLWIQRADGVQFWVDPTWTNNSGYVVYGYVSNGREIQCRPDRKYCVNYPSSLSNLPLPPATGVKIAPSNSANSTNRNVTIKDAGRTYVDIITGKVTHASGDDYNHIWSVGFHTPLKNMIDTSAMGFSIACESVPFTADTWHSMIGIGQIDYYKLDGGSALLFDYTLGYQLGSYIGIGVYGGGGIGWATDKTMPFAFENTSFAWKWTGGVRVMLDKISLRGEISYMNKSDYMLGMYIGIPISNRNSQH